MQRTTSAAVVLAAMVGASALLHSCRDQAELTGPIASLPRSASAVSGQEGTMGLWTAPFPWPIVAVHLHLLPNGHVFSVGRLGQPEEWDPATGAFTEHAVSSWLFCAGHTFLADGRLMVIGGHISDDHGLPDVNLYDFATGQWTRVENMAAGRWYGTATMLANGDILAIAGADSNGSTAKVPEVWHEGSGWRSLATASKGLSYYPRMFLAPNGLLFYAGTDPTSAYLDPDRGTWTSVGPRIVSNRLYGSAVMYEPGKVLYAGGGGNPPTNTAEVIDLNAPSPAWRPTGPMAFAREYLNVTLLADGTVLATGGNSVGGHTTNGAVHEAELWDPATERWRTLAANQITRVYHSTSILLPDGRVLHAGSGDGAGLPRETNAEVFSPPYLFNGDGTPATRPVITAAPGSVDFGQTFTVQTPDAPEIAKVTFLRLGSATHAFDQDQRFNRLDFTPGAGELSVTTPASANLAPPGYYLLFIVNASGVPSLARFVRYGHATGGGGPPPVATMAARAGAGQSAVVNTAVAVPPAVGVTDASGNPVPGISVDFAASAGGSVTGAAATTDAGGIASVGSWILSRTAGANSLTASSPGLGGSPVTFGATGTPGPPSAGASTATVPNGVVGSPTTLTVRSKDGYGNNTTSGGANVTVAVTGANTATPSVTDVGDGSYVASYTPVAAGADQVAITLDGAALGGSPFSSTVTGGGGTATAVALYAGNNQSATVGTTVATAPAVEVTDAAGRPVPGVVVTFAIAKGGGGITGARAASDAGGIATLGSWTLGTKAGTNKLTASATGLTGSPVVFFATGTAGAPVAMAVKAGDHQTAPAGTLVSVKPTVKVTDAYGNGVPKVAVRFAVTSGGGSITGNSKTTGSGGTAVVGSWTLGPVAGQNTLSATATGAGIAGNPVTFTATGT